MTDVEFEQLLSYKWHDGSSIKDMISDHILSETLSSSKTKKLLKEFTDTMYIKFVNRRM